MQVRWPAGPDVRAGIAGWECQRRPSRQCERGSALVETALVLPLLLTLAFGVVGIGHLTHAQLAVAAVAREAARAAALADTPSGALAAGAARGQEVAAGYGLASRALRITVDASRYGRGGQVLADARYEVFLDDLPLLGWMRLAAASTHVEPIDPYRSRWAGGTR